MKKPLSIFMLFPFLLSSHHVASSVQALSEVRGGTISFNFANRSDVERFDLYSSFLTMPNFNGDSLYSYIYAEQKVMLRNVQLQNYLIEADFGPSVYNGHIDMGFYLQASNPGNEVDHINAYNLQIKHDPNDSTFFLRVYRYENCIYRGPVKEVSGLPFWNSEWLHLSALINDGILTAYINNDYNNPILSYNIGPAIGLVGIRSFKSPSKVRNLKITAPEFAINYAEIDSLIEQYKNESSIYYTSSSWLNYNKAYIKAKTVRNIESNQLDINEASNALKQAYSGLVIKKSITDLNNLIAECEKINDASSYTQNSYKSFLFALSEAKLLNSSCSEDDISFAYALLKNRLDSLIRYGGQDNEK